MNIPKFSVGRPVFTTMLTLIVVVLGLTAFFRLKIDMLPAIELPTISVHANYAGASPQVMEQQVTQILEEIIATVPGIEEITSYTSEGWCDVRVVFSWGTNVDAAALEVQARIEQEINEMPSEMDRPRVRKFDIESFPVVIMGVSSTLNPVDMTELLENQIRYRFVRIPGVAQVDLWGGWNREIRVELDPDRIIALGIPLNQVLRALRDSNLDLPTGSIEQGRYEITLRAPAHYENIEQIENTVLELRDGARVRISDIADVQDTYQKEWRRIRINGERGIRVAIRKQPDANTVEVARKVLEEIEEVNRAYPQVRIIPVVNQGNLIERSISNVARSVLYGGGLAILILLFFLRSFRSTVVISLAIPISIVATFALLFFNGFTINLMTLGGLALGVGMMVDSSIVVLENIFRRRDETGATRIVAARDGAQEVASAITASTITTLVIFLPIIFVRGVSGVLFRELAYVIMFSLACSLIVSLSLVPMMASKFFSSREEEKKAMKEGGWHKRFYDFSTRQFTRLEQMYLRHLRAAMNHRFKIVLLAVLAVLSSLLLLPFIGSEFLPQSDEGEVRVNVRSETGTRMDLMDEKMKELEALVYPAVPEMDSNVVSIRGGWSNITLSLIPADDRERTNEEIAEDLREVTRNKFPGMQVFTSAPRGQFILDRILRSGGGMRVELRGFDLQILNLLAGEVDRVVHDIKGITRVEREDAEGTPQQNIRLNREKVADMGLTLREVTEVLRITMAGSRAGEFMTEGNAHRILVQLKDADRRSIDEVLNLTLATGNGELVALRNLVETSVNRAPSEIRRKNQQRQITIDLEIYGRDMGSVAEDVQEALDHIPRPEGYDLIVAGSYEEQQESFHEMVIALILAIGLVYMVLACQYESFRDPLIVMFSAPLAIIGVLTTLYFTGTTLNLQSYIGCIMLAGIVVNNAILLVDQTTQLLNQGKPVHDAVLEAGRRRLRPILMTTLTTILGLMPLALGLGEGAEAQAGLARAVIGGLTASTLITLILIPVVYSLFHEGWRKHFS